MEGCYGQPNLDNDMKPPTALTPLGLAKPVEKTSILYNKLANKLAYCFDMLTISKTRKRSQNVLNSLQQTSWLKASGQLEFL
jgi:hypothetical protein